MKFKDRVLLNELKFNDTDDQIIEYINENKELVVSQSIQKTAEVLYTVPNSIVRLSKKMGYDGFSQMKFKLKQEIEERDSAPATIIKRQISPNISRTLELINDDLIEAVVKRIESSRKVYFLGMGDSIYFCEMFSKNIKCIGKRSEFFQHRHDMIYSASNCQPKDLFFAISISGESREVIEASEKAHERGAVVISITHLCESSLSKLADINLFIWAPAENKNGYNSTDRVGMMILIREISEKFWNIKP